MDMKTRLIQIVGEDRVSDGLAEQHVYASDMTENPSNTPLMVVMPRTVDEIREIVLAANETKTPLVPFVTGQNVGGLTIPQVSGAVIVDLKSMNRILEVDEDAMYVLVEPGVTFGHLRKHLDQNHPNLRYTYPLAPPYTSVLANALLEGLCDLSTKVGAMADFINGLEAVLPTGEVVRVGTGAVGEGNWFSRYPLPDFVGLFAGWQGMSGIVTKIALQLWPRMKYNRHFALVTFGEIATTRILTRVTRTQVLDDSACVSTPVVKMINGVTGFVEFYEGEPDYGILLTVSGNTKEEVSAKSSVIEAIIEEERKIDPRQTLIPWDALTRLMGDRWDAFVDLPSEMYKVLAEHDGLTWVGTYIHPRHWGTVLEKGRKIVERHGFELIAFLKPMKGMHFGEFKFIFRFPKDEATLDRIRKCNLELLEMALDHGAIPYKTPVWAAKLLQERIDPSFVMLFRKVRDALDPNGIMNPGRWGL
ncbi:MAG: FAD-binding oxidoreductase [Candidatus Thorarchaeota archaeon]|nr:FAD-binding oxidoreductase [Candidatus Thorarchaeota archaeon]